MPSRFFQRAVELQVLAAYRAFCRSAGYELHGLIGEAVGARGQLHGGVVAQLLLGPAVEQGNNWQGEVTLQRRESGSHPAWLLINGVRNGQAADVWHQTVTTIDISVRKRYGPRLRFLVRCDVLTERPDRARCIKRLSLALQQTPRRIQKVAVPFIDLDRFKTSTIRSATLAATGCCGRWGGGSPGRYARAAPSAGPTATGVSPCSTAWPMVKRWWPPLASGGGRGQRLSSGADR